MKTLLAVLLVSSMIVLAPAAAANANVGGNKNISDSDRAEYCPGMTAVDVLHVTSRVFNHKIDAYLPLDKNEMGAYYPASDSTISLTFAAPFVPCQAIIALKKENLNREQEALNLQLLALKDALYMAYFSQKAADNVPYNNRQAKLYYTQRAQEGTANIVALGAIAAYNGQNEGQMDNIGAYIDEIFKQPLTISNIVHIHNIVYWHMTYISARDGWIEGIDNYMETVTGKKIYGNFLTKLGVPKSGKLVLNSYIELLDESENLFKGISRTVNAQLFYSKLQTEVGILG